MNAGQAITAAMQADMERQLDRNGRHAFHAFTPGRFDWRDMWESPMCRYCAQIKLVTPRR